MKEVKLGKDWTILNERVILAGSRVRVPERIAKQLEEQGLLYVKKETTIKEE
jgi:hypothetical protein